jgi:hypothetical protein
MNEQGEAFEERSSTCNTIGDRIARMQRPESSEYDPNYQKYFDLIPNGDYENLLAQNTIETARLFDTIPSQKHDHHCAEGKWTIKEVLMHIIDTRESFRLSCIGCCARRCSPYVSYG